MRIQRIQHIQRIHSYSYTAYTLYIRIHPPSEYRRTARLPRRSKGSGRSAGLCLVCLPSLGGCRDRGAELCPNAQLFRVKVGQDEKVAKLVKLVRGPSSGALKAERRCCRTAAIVSQRLVSLARQNREQTRREAPAAMPQLGGRQFPPHRRREARARKVCGCSAGQTPEAPPARRSCRRTA